MEALLWKDAGRERAVGMGWWLCDPMASAVPGS